MVDPRQGTGAVNEGAESEGAVSDVEEKQSFDNECEWNPLANFTN